ncbi:hypothetical protein JZ751_012627 [Albula glossodonta]|uniref:PRELI/MSF1 domain-containing protein n=1 Tax=Albula glossodonta TaxID=121402 RepID=A0A8T2NUY7_9TELE|nr:hypothetical protein JZ751_012627 [Albula glossodonta]
MGKYFVNEVDVKSTWDQVFSAFWQRYPNPFSTHVLTEDVVFREVTKDHRLLTRRLLTKTNRLPRWAERFFPTNLSRSVYIVEDSITVEERCVFQENQDRPAWTRLKREAWILSTVYGFSRPIQEFGLARFKSNQMKAMKGLELALSNLHGDSSPRPRRDAVKEASEKAKEAALAATEKAQTLASAASPHKPQQFVVAGAPSAGLPPGPKLPAHFLFITAVLVLNSQVSAALCCCKALLQLCSENRPTPIRYHYAGSDPAQPHPKPYFTLDPVPFPPK